MDNLEVEKERRNRIRLSIFAYAYEYLNVSLIDDFTFDKISFEIRPEISTGNATMDEFFRTKFNPSTGMWIRDHPDLKGIVSLYNRYFSNNPKD